MSPVPHITDVDFKAAPSEITEKGLVGWISCTVDETFRLSGITLRTTEDEKLTLSYPARKTKDGGQHFFFRPVDDRARRAIEHQILGAMRHEGAES